ncbi:MAG: hypothetical protein ACI8ZM_003642 [Crocinitomix sp.]|jgi:hypothetical protein
MTKSKLWIKVDKILWEDWDPIAVNDYGGTDVEWQDEYSGYVPSIVKLLLEQANELKIAKLLHEHANVNMGLITGLADHLEIAKKLKRLTT